MELCARVRVVMVLVIACCLATGSCQHPTDNHKGCYYDGDGVFSDRVLQDLIDCQGVEGVCQQSCGPGEAYCESGTMMTIDNCRTLCRDGNFQYYGLENGRQCFCGGALSDPLVYGIIMEGVNCSDPCTGDMSKTCGGEFKIDIYEFQAPVEDPGCFFPGSVPYAIIEDVGIGIGETLSFRCQPGYEVVGDSQLTCMPNRTWSGDVLPICNYTGVIPETTSEEPTTTVQTTTEELPTTSTETITTGISTTMSNPTTILQDVTTIDSETTKVHSNGSTVKPKPTKKPQSEVRDIMIYVIIASAVMGFLLVVCVIGILACTYKKRSGNAKQAISLKPDDLAPVTLLNSGYTPDEGDPESGQSIPDILLAGSTPQAVDNQYAIRGEHGTEMTSWSKDETQGDKKHTDQSQNYEEMKDLSHPPNPIYENSKAVLTPPQGAAASPTVESEYASVGGRPTASDQTSVSTDTTEEHIGSHSTEYENFQKWNSEDTLISEEGRALYADPDTTAATKL